MNRIFKGAMAGLAIAMLAVPGQAQFSESYTFLKAVKDRDFDKVRDILANPGSVALNARDRASGEGALHTLVRGRDLPWLNLMLTRGARPDVQNNQGESALHLAARIGWVEGAQSLLISRANPNLANSRGETPLILAVQSRDPAFVRLLMSRGGDPKITDNVAGLSALDYARRDARSAQLVRLLETEARQPALDIMGRN